jgi:hypothetical protein
VSAVPSPAVRLGNPDALLSRSDLRELAERGVAEELEAGWRLTAEGEREFGSAVRAALVRLADDDPEAATARAYRPFSRPIKRRAGERET